jgi:hypothetical protein
MKLGSGDPDPVSKERYVFAAASPLILIWVCWTALRITERWGSAGWQIGIMLLLFPVGCATAFLSVKATRRGTSRLGRNAGWIAAVLDVGIGIGTAVIGFIVASTPPIA